MAARATSWFFGVCAGLVSCLPADDRPVPGSSNVTVTADETMLGSRSSTLSVDGWDIALDRFLITLGNSRFEDSDVCADYYDADYRRILNMRLPGPQKLGINYALGQCEFRFRVAGPGGSTLLGTDVTEEDKARLGTPGSDAYATNRGISLEIAGTATRDAARKTFAWSFRQRVTYYECSPDGQTTVYDVQGGKKVDIALWVHGETLFLDRIDPSVGRIRFGEIALADDRYGNADGIVTADELALVPLADIQLNGLYEEPDRADSATPPGDAGALHTLQTYMYVWLFPNVVRIGRTGTCKFRVGDYFYEGEL